MTRRAIVGLDVGTTAAKAVAFGIDDPWHRAALREYPMRSPHYRWQVQDPEEVAAAVLAALSEVVGPDLEVIGLSVSTAMHGLIGLDDDRRPVTPLLTWADGRATEQARALRASGAAAVLYEISGVPVHPMSPLTKLMWFGDSAPEEAARVRWWVGLKDYILLQLSDQLVTELSSASGTGLMDRHRLRYSRTALEIAGVSQTTLPEIAPTTSSVPLSAAAAARAGLPAGLPVVLGAGDGPLGNVGTGALDRGSVGLSLGTSGAARMMVDRSTIDPQGRLFCYALTEDLWVVGGAVSTGGSVVRWAREIFGSDSDEQLLSWAAQAPPGSDGLLMVPYLFAERAPLWNPELDGAYLGMRSGQTRDHFVRAALEGVALQLAVIMDALEDVEPVAEVRATGGAFRSPLWREIMAGVLARPVHVLDGAEGTARGAAALGLHALGVCEDLPAAVAQLQPPQPVAATLPQDVEAYAALRGRLLRLVRDYDGLAALFGG